MPDPHRTLANSLHGTGYGMDYVYKDGMARLTGVPYANLGCKNCHATGCASCHDVDEQGEPLLGGKENEAATCYACHSRQKTMQTKINPAKGDEDVHLAAGFACGDCHTSNEMHGDGQSYNSFLQAGFSETKCENCHDVAGLSQMPGHMLHAGTTVDCAACHVKRVVTCYNCHFNAEVMHNKKAHYGAMTDFVLLVKNAEGKITTGTFQTLDWVDDVTDPESTTRTQLTVAPYYAHTVTSSGRTCNDCHKNEAIKEYEETGKIQFTWWDETEGKIKHKTGVIPYIDGTLEMTFVRPSDPAAAPPYAPTDWVVVGTDMDLEHKLAGPLSAEEIDKMSK